MTLEEFIDIAAPPERVWDVTVEIERWPDWTPTVTAVALLDTGPIRVGTRARLTQPGHRPAVWTITHLDPPHLFVWETRTLGTRVIARHEMERIETGTRVRLAIDVSGLTSALLGPLVRRASQRFLPQEAAGLKRVCEA